MRRVMMIGNNGKKTLIYHWALNVIMTKHGIYIMFITWLWQSYDTGLKWSESSRQWHAGGPVNSQCGVVLELSRAGELVNCSLLLVPIGRLCVSVSVAYLWISHGLCNVAIMDVQIKYPSVFSLASSLHCILGCWPYLPSQTTLFLEQNSNPLP